MHTNPQSQSALITRLPREILDSIYLELWRSCGLRQHILWHGRPPNKHFCRWSCTTEYEVEDQLQRDVEDLRVRLGVPLGQDITRVIDTQDAPYYCRRLQSPWLNHWRCGERAEREHGHKAIFGPATGQPYCFHQQPAGRQFVPYSSPYIPMLLSCKLISAQCLRSIYESTTWIFTDMATVQSFFGHCRIPPALRQWPRVSVSPPAFFEFARSVELSLSPDFPMQVSCVVFDAPEHEERHDIYDFHWLHLGRMKNLKSLAIWISARSITCRVDSDNNFVGIKAFDTEALGKILAPFGYLESVTVSTPLSSNIGPEEGWVEGATPPTVRLWKRGPGDRFHPFLNLILYGNHFDGLIHTSHRREVRLAQNGGNHDVMPEI